MSTEQKPPEMPELPPLPQAPTETFTICPSEEKFTRTLGFTSPQMRSFGESCYRLGVERERERAAKIADRHCVGGPGEEVPMSIATEIRKGE